MVPASSSHALIPWHRRLEARVLLGVTIVFAERLGHEYDLDAAGAIKPVHLTLAKIATAAYLAPLTTGVMTWRNRRWRRVHLVAACATLALTVAAPAGAQTARELSEAVAEYVAVNAPVVALTNVQVVDGTGAPPLAGATIVIRDGVIEAVGTDVEVPAGAEVLDLVRRVLAAGILGLTPTMGGSFLVASVLASVLLWGRLDNLHVVLALLLRRIGLGSALRLGDE